ncbi:sulfite exporter TauE/SafE family protein [Planctomycetota bacterium]|nr:sulfite exporter TauE/SafE family protein [Planctomycetota bacterium]
MPNGVPLWFIVTMLALAAIIIGVSKSGFGSTTAIIAMPIIANLIPIEQTLGFMLPLLMVADAIAIKQHWGRQSWKHVEWVCSGAFAGIMITMVALWLLANQTMLIDEAVRLLVGILCLAFVFFQLARSMGMKLPHVPESRAGGIGCGIVTGVVSTIANAGGPVVSIYMLEQGLGKTKMAGTMVAMFTLINWMKVPGFLFLGILSPGAVLLSVCFLPIIPVGSLLGIWLHGHVNEKLFNGVIYSATAASSILLIFKAIAN